MHLNCIVVGGVFGARLTGAGFGGTCLALVAEGEAEAIAQPFTYPDLRDRLFASTHPKSDRANAQ